VRIVDPEMNDVAAGERGEIVVQGPNVMAGYWRQPSATEASLTDGWFHTGDVAVVDDDGAVTIVDRIKDMIISGGENIYPAEVESVLHGHPAVADCAVVGRTDPVWGEVGRAVVTVHEGSAFSQAEMEAYLKGRLARYKIPKDLVIVQEIPRNATGKILRAKVRSQLGNVIHGTPATPGAE